MLPFFILVIATASSCLGARLDSSYLPPRGSSGSGAGFVQAPYRPSGGGGFGASSFGGGSFGGGSYGGSSFGSSGPFIPIIRYDNQPNRGDGSYSYSYETGNGIKADERGYQTGPESQAVQGSYSYTGPDGKLYTVTYTADERGFIATGDHLPTPPPIPPEILASLQQTGQGVGASGGAYRPPSYNPSSGYHYKK